MGFRGLIARVFVEETMVCGIALLLPLLLYALGGLDVEQVRGAQYVFYFVTALLHGVSHKRLYVRQDGKITDVGPANPSHRAFLFPLLGGLFRLGIFWNPFWGVLAALALHLIYDYLPGVPMLLAGGGATGSGLHSALRKT